MSKKYALYIGRWQNWHKGHEWLINQQLNQGKNVWVAIRDVAVDENNPKTAQQILKELSIEPFFINNFDKIFLSIIPDIESVNYGRGVGYDVIYHEPPLDIEQISATKIRNGEIDTSGNLKNNFSEIRFNDTLSIYKTNITKLDNIQLAKDFFENCKISKFTTFPNEYQPGIQSKILTQSKNIISLKNIINNMLVSFFNLTDEFIYFNQDWVYISDSDNPYSGYHTHDGLGNVEASKEKPKWTIVYYVNMPDNLNGDEGKLFFKKDDMEYSILPNIGDLVMFPANLMHRPIPNPNSTTKRIVYGINIAILDRNKEYDKKLKTLL